MSVISKSDFMSLIGFQGQRARSVIGKSDVLSLIDFEVQSRNHIYVYIVKEVPTSSIQCHCQLSLHFYKSYLNN